jgi:hypothetical protein
MRHLFLIDWLICEEIKHVAQSPAFGAVDFGVRTLITTHRGEVFVLHIENFCKHSTCCTKLIGYEFIMVTLWTMPFLMSHPASLNAS